jgi:hypothetical protein
MDSHQPAIEALRWPVRLAANTSSAAIAALIRSRAEDARRQAALCQRLLPVQHASADAAREAAMAAAERLARSRSSQEELLAAWRRRHEGDRSAIAMAPTPVTERLGWRTADVSATTASA